AANAPRQPKKRSPIISATLQMFGPGSAWPTARISMNCSLVSQRFCSHSTRCATAITPPKPCSARIVNVTKRSFVEDGCASGSDSAVMDEYYLSQVRSLVGDRVKRDGKARRPQPGLGTG